MTNNYNAGITSYALWFNEFKLCLSLYLQGKSISEIKKLSDENNIFELPSRDRARRASRNLTKRVEALPKDIQELFSSLDISNQKIIALLSMMLNNRLLDEFVFEVYRNEIVFGDRVLEENEMDNFIRHKQVESEQVSRWTDETAKRVKGSLKTILRDAGLLKRRNKVDDVLQL